MEVFVVLAVVAVIVAVVAWAKGATVRKLRNARMFPIAELPEGVSGRVTGQAYPVGETLQGPLTGRPCVYYIALVEQHVSTGRSSYWKTLVREERGVTFVMTDGTGRAIVDPTGAEIALSFDSRSTSGTFDDANEIEEAFLARYHKQSQGWVFNKRLRYREAVIHVGEQIAVLGEGVREPDPEAAPSEGYRGAPPTRLRLTSTPRFPLVISDDPSTTQPTTS